MAIPKRTCMNMAEEPWKAVLLAAAFDVSVEEEEEDWEAEEARRRAATTQSAIVPPKKAS